MGYYTPRRLKGWIKSTRVSLGLQVKGLRIESLCSPAVSMLAERSNHLFLRVAGPDRHER